MKHIVPLNAFSSITVCGLVLENKRPRAQTFYRGVVKPGPCVSIELDYLTRPDGVPPRPPSILPPPGDQNLTLSLGERLGRGRVGSVHAVTVMETAPELPGLVVKVSRHKRSGSMAQEAWFYEELEQLQGVSVPRCYGFFQARLQDESHVLTWGSSGYEYEDDSECEDEEYDSEDECEDGEYDPEGHVVNEGKYEKELPGQGRVLSILLLERLGGNIPVGQPLDPAIKDDVYELFNDVGRFGIEPLDIRWSNILSASEATESLEMDSSREICPNHGHVHRWRLIDFDLCRKSDGNSYFIDGSNDDWLKKLFTNLVKGYNMELWDY